MPRITFLLVLLVCTAYAMPAAERHALLVGVGAYKTVNKLDGPPNDVEALRSLLVDTYGYRSKFVHTLVDQQATKKAILQAMKDLIEEVKPGDYVFFYYSGHGTSFYDSHNTMKQLIAEDTGASLPVDFDGSSLDAFGKSVLLGHEMRPYFTALDEKAQVFAVYDSCFSQDAMKALPQGTPKYVPLSDAVKGAPKGDLDDAEEAASKAPVVESNASLPYKHLVALSAAKRDQAAVDLSAALVKRHPDATIDGMAHGQLTNALLLGLRGAADKNHDGIISHEELFNYVNEVSVSWHHNPKLRISTDSDAILDEPAFDAKQIVRDSACQHEPVRLPKVSAPTDLLNALGKGIVAVTEGWDVKAVPSGNGFLLYDAGGIQMNPEPMTRQQTLDRLQAEPLIQQLSDLRYCQQKHNIQLTIAPADQGKYVSGQQIEFSAKLDHDAYLLVIDIDQQGGVTVVYPTTGIELKKANVKNVFQEGRVQTPFGVDLIKAFAFEVKPPELDRFLVPPKASEVYLHPGDPLLKVLLKMLAPDNPERSETRLRLITSKD